MNNLFAALDKNADNKVSASEFIELWGGELDAYTGTEGVVDAAEQRIRFMDRGDKDGLLDLAEFTEAMQHYSVPDIVNLAARVGGR